MSNRNADYTESKWRTKSTNLNACRNRIEMESGRMGSVSTFFFCPLDNFIYVIGPIQWKPNQFHYFFCLSDKQTTSLHANTIRNQNNSLAKHRRKRSNQNKRMRRRRRNESSVHPIQLSLFWLQLHIFAVDIVNATHDVTYTIDKQAIDVFSKHWRKTQTKSVTAKRSVYVWSVNFTICHKHISPNRGNFNVKCTFFKILCLLL